jgi:ABC-type multidrug transport system fused ATPase/permease subunit
MMIDRMVELQDPFSTMSDAELWSILDRIHLSNTVKCLPGLLDFAVEENGGNFSLGERQLLCLARAMARRSRVVIMDEASASLDFETDQLIRTFVEREFKDATVITIAHRLRMLRPCLLPLGDACD